ncbi:SIMPL domain-containing protein [Falsiroseomonas tokyonensis]|uniref:SIMPL domain-containing protein n=1 Tax=Falsiroseomonas tokyonensis TaxID=430521 RepID=A0ABV7BQW5_9PROT|nr:SIMPL domain-containing protein [Falsiroseomonas tokyonensis]MBU8536456.1 SIMPL domain-containing protein [Falsiroseomonas tokyonensis]
MLHPIRALTMATLLLAPPALAPPALAQPAGLTETLLHLGETAEVTRAPDEVVATLRAEARAGTAAAAQQAVNRAIAAAVTRAQATPGIQVSTGGYWTGRVEEQRNWQASQAVTLRGGDGPALLELAGTLQGQGLAMVSLDWTLRRETERAAREEAARLALEALQRRAAAVAQQLNLQLVGLREVRIDAPERGPRPMAMAARSSVSSSAAPVAVAEDAVVRATVEAVAVLRP